MTLMDQQVQPSRTARRHGSHRGIIVTVMISSLLFAAGARYWADERREAAIPTHGTDANTASLSSLNSFALGLLLGGLRGPLVMILWTESENQKSEKNLEGVDTQIELIRLLQPEFDTVHIFQIWNKAYNISVQMASMANKYDVILGALDYAFKVDASKPDDINIVAAIGQVYFDKLGSSSEKNYYRKRVRQESQPHAVAQKIRQQDPGWHRVQLDPVLDTSFNILPELMTPLRGRARPKDLPADQEWDDGSPLQYLPKFEPYPDGVSTYGFAYNYYKRAEVLLNVQKQHHDQLSDQVIDSRPGLSLKFWAEDEMDQGHRRELQAFGAPIPENSDDLMNQTVGVNMNDTPRDPLALKLAISAYGRAEQLIPESENEYVRFILHFPDREQTSRSYMEEMRATVQLATGDFEYLTAMVSPASERPAHLIKAIQAYAECRHQAYENLLRYYVDNTILKAVLPPGFGIDKTTEHKGISDLSLQQANDAMQKADLLKQQSGNQYVNTDRFEFDRMVHRSAVRVKTIAGLLH